MCDGGSRVPLAVNRRVMLLAGGVAAVAAIASRQHPALATTPVAPGLDIVPRSEWGGDLRVRGAMAVEQAGDVRFLLVHHSASTNDYVESDTVAFLRSFYELHTTEKGWPDVAYNFFVDRFGVVYEARTGSLDGPVKGDATGGSQGFAQLCCFVGDHSVDRPTLAAHTSMVRLLAWLADRYRIPTEPGATTSFISRGSNLHPAGTEVTCSTISGHRDMSQTVCPGDAAYAMVRQDYQRAVTTRRAELVTPPTTDPPTSLPTAPSTSDPRPGTTLLAASSRDEPGAATGWPLLPTAFGAVAVAAAAGVVAVRRRGVTTRTGQS